MSHLSGCPSTQPAPSHTLNCGLGGHPTPLHVQVAPSPLEAAAEMPHLNPLPLIHKQDFFFFSLERNIYDSFKQIQNSFSHLEPLVQRHCVMCERSTYLVELSPYHLNIGIIRQKTYVTGICDFKKGICRKKQDLSICLPGA